MSHVVATLMAESFPNRTLVLISIIQDAYSGRVTSHIDSFDDSQVLTCHSKNTPFFSVPTPWKSVFYNDGQEQELPITIQPPCQS